MENFLFQFCQCFLDAAHGFDDVFIGSGVTHADTFRGTEGCSAHAGYVAYFEQVHGKVIGVVDDTVAVFLAKEEVAFREEVEAPSGTFTSNPGISFASLTIKSRRRWNAWRISSTGACVPV